MPFKKRKKIENLMVAGTTTPMVIPYVPTEEVSVLGPDGNIYSVKVPRNLRAFMLDHLNRISAKLALFWDLHGPSVDPAEYRKHRESIVNEILGQRIHLDITPAALDLEAMTPAQLAALYAVLEIRSGQELKALPSNTVIDVEFREAEHAQGGLGNVDILGDLGGVSGGDGIQSGIQGGKVNERTNERNQEVGREVLGSERSGDPRSGTVSPVDSGRDGLSGTGQQGQSVSNSDSKTDRGNDPAGDSGDASGQRGSSGVSAESRRKARDTVRESSKKLDEVLRKIREEDGK